MLEYIVNTINKETNNTINNEIQQMYRFLLKEHYVIIDARDKLKNTLEQLTQSNITSSACSSPLSLSLVRRARFCGLSVCEFSTICVAVDAAVDGAGAIF